MCGATGFFYKEKVQRTGVGSGWKSYNRNNCLHVDWHTSWGRKGSYSSSTGRTPSYSKTNSTREQESVLFRSFDFNCHAEFRILFAELKPTANYTDSFSSGREPVNLHDAGNNLKLRKKDKLPLVEFSLVLSFPVSQV